MDTTAAGTPAPMTPPAQQSATASANAAPAPTLKAPAPDEVAAVMPENAGNRNPQGDKYKQEVASLLDAYEAKQARVSAEREAERQAKPPEPEGLREGESWDAIYKDQSPEVQRAMAEVRKMVTRKTQEVAAEKRKLEAQNKALLESGLINELSQQAGQMPEDFDPFNPDHLSQVIEAKVAARLKQVLEPLHQQHQQHEASARYQTFREQHPDLVENPEIKTGVYKALQADPTLKLEAAYWMVKGKTYDQQKRADEEQRAVRRRAAQRAAQVPAAGRRPGNQVLDHDLKDLPAWAIYERLKAQQT